jgi:hypothetical protein
MISSCEATGQTERFRIAASHDGVRPVQGNVPSVPVSPAGAKGPLPTDAPGMQYQGGAGGNGMDQRVSGVRIMDETPNQGARVSYNNSKGQKVNPATGRTVSNQDPSAHIPLKPKPPQDQQ